LAFSYRAKPGLDKMMISQQPTFSPLKSYSNKEREYRKGKINRKKKKKKKKKITEMRLKMKMKNK
jgi:hypothetical protein